MNFQSNTQGYAPKKSLGPKKALILALACAIVVLLFVFFAAFSPVVTIPAGQTGVVTLFGRVSDATYGEGLHAKNPLARVIVMDNRTQKETVTMQAFSSDIQQVDVIATVNFHVPREACSTLYQRVGLGYYEQVMEPRIQEGVKAVFADYSAEKLIGARSTLADQVMEILAPEMEEYGISVTAVSIENVDFTDAFTDAVEDKQVAEQTKLRTEIEQAQLLVVEQTDAQRRIIAANADAQEREILAEADASVKQIEADAAAYAVRVQAEAEAEANAMIAASLAGQLVQYQQIQQWDGSLPAVYGASDPLPILDMTGAIEEDGPIGEDDPIEEEAPIGEDAPIGENEPAGEDAP